MEARLREGDCEMNPGIFVKDMSNLFASIFTMCSMCLKQNLSDYQIFVSVRIVAGWYCFKMSRDNKRFNDEKAVKGESLVAPGGMVFPSSGHCWWQV